MNENIINWILKIKDAYAVCACGNKCHIDVTIRSDAIRARAICPNCGRVFTAQADIRVISKAKLDLTFKLIEYVKKGFKMPYEDD
jgi:hypothetical protein